MALPGPKPSPSNVRQLYPASHRPESQHLQLPVEAPPEPDWTHTFPQPAARAKLLEDLSPLRRLQMESDANLDALNKRARLVAHATWELVVPDLLARGILAKVDHLALKELCVVVARLDQAEREISAKGPLLIGERGMVKNPALTSARMYRDAFNRLLPEFGLSPSARTRLKAQDFGTDDGDGLFD